MAAKKLGRPLGSQDTAPRQTYAGVPVRRQAETIREHWGTMSSRAIGRMLGISGSRVRVIAEKIGLPPLRMLKAKDEVET